MENNNFIFKKEVDWSTLNMGINIPVRAQDIFLKNLRISIKRGESRAIKITIENTEYSATLSNIDFDTIKYPTHKDLLQVRYTPNSPIAKALQLIFNESYLYLLDKKAKLVNKRRPISVPENKREYLIIYSTPIDDMLYIECVTKDCIDSAKKTITSMGELEIEQLLQTESNASIITRNKLAKIRKLDKSICDSLKQIYKYKCQICGLYIGEQYDACVINAHHIEYFTVSLNNNADNILVVCPNHHSIIHATNPDFIRDEKAFKYPNGLVEKLSLNVHL